MDEAAESFNRALEIRPDYVEALINLGVVHQQQGELREAASSYENALRLKPDDPGIRYRLAVVLEQLGNPGQAVDHLRQMISTDPVYYTAAVKLIRILTASRDPAIRNRPGAVNLAEQLAAATRQEDPVVLDVLAAAYAEMGRWDEALATARRAIELATAAGQKELSEQIEIRRRLYEQRTPFRDSTID